MPTDRKLALEKYRRNAPWYDHAGRRLERARVRAIELLYLQPGDVVLDVGCGTGLSFPMLEEGVGPEGRIVGIEQSPDMLTKARDRAEGHGWKNVTLIESPVEAAQVPLQADAALFSFVHDILQTPRALENLFNHVKPGGRVAAAGTKWAPWWLLPLNLQVWQISRFAVTTREGLGQPWHNLKRFIPELRIQQLSLGRQYLASGQLDADQGA